MALLITERIRKKLALKHAVTEGEILEAFSNRTGKFLEDTREEHLTEPVTRWFIAETDRGRLLKVMFMQTPNGDIQIKSAYTPSEAAIAVYEQYAN